MLDKFQSNIDSEFPFLRNAKLYLAISGGKDSMTLSSLLLQSGINHSLLHCNFKLRGKESDADEQFLKEYAQKNGLEFHVKHFDTYQISSEQQLSIQECARKLRYEWFRTFIDFDDDSFLLTAHHRDDSIETFFINLFRGTGFRGLSGIPVFANKIIRPLSDFTSEDVYRYIDDNHIEYRRDSSNQENNYLRNKIRNTLMPSILEVEPHLHEKMGALFDEITAIKNFVDTQIDTFRKEFEKTEGSKLSYQLDQLRGLDSFFRTQLFRDFGIYRKNRDAFTQFLDAETGAQFFTDSHQFLVDRKQLILIPKSETKTALNAIFNSTPISLVYGELHIAIHKISSFSLVKNNASIQQIDASGISFPLIIRPWHFGDKIQPLGMNGSKLISDILIDKKIDRIEKKNSLVLTNSKNEVLCLIGHVIDERYKITSDTKEILEIVIS